MKNHDPRWKMDIVPMGRCVRVYGRAFAAAVPRGHIFKHGRRKYVSSLWLYQNGLDLPWPVAGYGTGWDAARSSVWARVIKQSWEVMRKR